MTHGGKPVYDAFKLLGNLFYGVTLTSLRGLSIFRYPFFYCVDFVATYHAVAMVVPRSCETGTFQGANSFLAMIDYYFTFALASLPRARGNIEFVCFRYFSSCLKIHFMQAIRPSYRKVAIRVSKTEEVYFLGSFRSSLNFSLCKRCINIFCNNSLEQKSACLPK